MADIKLFKLAAEINISKDTIVEYLQGKGFSVENKPITKLNDAMVDAVYDKFKKEKRAAEVQRTKIQSIKSIKKPDTSESDAKNNDREYDNYVEPQTKQDVSAPAPEPIKEVTTKQETTKSEVSSQVQEVKVEAKPTENTEKAEAQKATKAKTVKKTETSDSTNKIEENTESKLSEKPNKKEEPSKAEETKPIIQESAPTPVVEKKVQKEEESVIIPAPRPADEYLPKVGEKIDLSKFGSQGRPGMQRERDKQRGDFRGGNRDDNRGNREGANRDNRDNRGNREGANRESGFRGRDGERRPVGDTRFVKNERVNDKNKDNNFRKEKKESNIPQLDVKRYSAKPQGQNDQQQRPPRTNQDGKPFESRNQQGRNQDNRNQDNRNQENRGAGDPNDPKKKRKRKIVEVDANSDNKQNLKGLTIVGKINLPGGQRPQQQGEQRGRYNDRNNQNNQNRKPGERPNFENRGERPRYQPPANLEDVKRSFGPDAPKGGAKAPALAAKGKKKRSIKDSISEVDVNRAIKETLSGMDENSSSYRARMKQKKKQERAEKEQRIQDEIDRENAILQLSEFVTTSDLAALINISPNEIILKCMQLGLMVSINQRLDKDTITLIADDYGIQVEFLDEKASQIIEDEPDSEETLITRPPIVTIMGHVDHGKTSLLDYIRKTSVVAGESGGITQHIGAYMVEAGGKQITFLDTPGHEAFTAMRARGAQVTDLVVLVVAADDNVMPQTIEAISHSKAANVPIVVAINKMDKPDAKPDRVKQQLADYDVLVEEWGGKNQAVEISAKFGNNVDKLLEAILLEAEVLDLKANPDRLARGTVIEAHMDKGLGAVSTIVVQKGTLKVGDAFVAGSSFGKVRAMFDERGKKLDEATPSHPARIIGFDAMPTAGDTFISLKTEVEARVIANERKQLKREQEFRQVRMVTLDQISAEIQIGGVKDLYLIIKADVSGSVEALADSLIKLSHDEVRINILHKGVGSITESDVNLAKASGAIVVAFHTNPTPKARRLADDEEVEIRQYEIIYDCINDIQLALEGMLRPVISEVVTGTVEVRQVFKISKIGSIAGCYVTNGKVNRNDKIKVLRDGFSIFTGGLKSLKREKDDAKDVNEGFECGILIDGFNDIAPGDIIECYKITETKRTLKK
jgi:translation initiation factor IF-2